MYSTSSFDFLSDSHPCFIRGQNLSCLSSIKRIKIKGGQARGAAGSKSEKTPLTPVLAYPFRTMSTDMRERSFDSKSLGLESIFYGFPGIYQEDSSEPRPIEAMLAKPMLCHNYISTPQDWHFAYQPSTFFDECNILSQCKTSQIK